MLALGCWMDRPYYENCAFLFELLIAVLLTSHGPLSSGNLKTMHCERNSALELFLQDIVGTKYDGANSYNSKIS